MKRSAESRRTTNLSDSLHQRLNAYALAAGAAGMGVLACTQPATAKIVYTKAHRVIGLHSSYNLDLNHDGINDFTISNTTHGHTSKRFFALFEEPAVGNSGMATLSRGGQYLLATALKPGTVIGPEGAFVEGKGDLAGIISAYFFYAVFGQWVNAQQRYLGLRFKIKGQTHYGWARLNVEVDYPPPLAIHAIVTGYAYETIPNKPIIAGKTKGSDDLANHADFANTNDPRPGASPTDPTPEMPRHASLGTLALGAQGVPLWQREETARGND
jgi:hypothetical protein